MALKRLGDYELLRKIGAGGMAEVWMGRRAALAGASKAVAIKLLARELVDDPAYRQMFLDEARLSMLLTNSNVVQVFDVGEIAGECFMVMEWVDGLNLAELTRKMVQAGDKLATVVAAHVIGEVLRALAYAHGLHHEGRKATIVHRDVSPQNVLVSVSGEVKLADFGVARLAREETSGLHVKGKLRYMAPEQLRGRSREPTVDLYAVGAIFHELLEGQRFRQTYDEGDLYSMVLDGEVPPLTVEVPPELARLRAGLLEPDPKRRIQTADEALELLYGWPGYRNSSIELGKLIRRWVGVGAPRSGIVSAEALIATAAQATQGAKGGRPGKDVSVASNAETRDAARPHPPPASRPSSSLSPASAPSSGPEDAAAATVVDVADSGPLADRGATETRTWVSSTPETDATAVLAEASGSTRASSMSSMLIVAAVTLALSFGVFGLGFPLGWWGGAEPQPPVAVAETGPASGSGAGPGDSRDASAKTREPEAVEPKTPAEVEVPSGETGEAPSGETGEAPSGETGEAPSGEAEAGEGEVTKVETTKVEKPRKATKKRKEPSGPPAEVTFVAGDFSYVWIKIAGKEIVAQPVVADVEIKPGRHRLYMRETAEDEWKSVRTVKIETGKRYKLRMRKPADFSLTEQ